MKRAKEVCEMLGINKNRIKYFKKQGIFVSENKETGYSEKDIDRLKKIVVLTKMGLTCGDIKKIDDGEISFRDCLEERIKKMKSEIKQLSGSLKLSAELLNNNVEYDSISSDYYLDEIHRREGEGEEFMDYENWQFELEMNEKVICPNCKYEDMVDLGDYVVSESSNENENGMGPDLTKYFDSECCYKCPMCGKAIRISGWKREYPIGAFDSEDISVSVVENIEEKF